MKKVSAIVCSYNEESTIREVLLSIHKCHLTNELIVVDDGSYDNTSYIISKLEKLIDFKTINLENNKGKGYAMARGVDESSGEIIVFIDADLSHLNETHIWQLLNPLFTEEADMVLGQPQDTLINHKVNPFKSFSGQRAVYKKDLLPILHKIRASRFGVETIINLYFQAENKKTKFVLLKGLHHPTKFSKVSKPQALVEFIKEGNQITKAVLQNSDLAIRTIKNQIFKEKVYLF